MAVEGGVGRPPDGVGEGEAEGVGVGDALGVGDGLGVGDALGVGDGLGVGVGVAVEPLTEKDTDCCELAPLESHALMIAVCFPDATASDTSILPVVT